MNEDTIYRQAAIEALRVAYWDENIQSAKDDPCIVDAMTDWAIRQVKTLPSAESEIIRCGDCKWWDFAPDSTMLPDWHRCRRFGKMHTTYEDFCSRGERRTDE